MSRPMEEDAPMVLLVRLLLKPIHRFLLNHSSNRGGKIGTDRQYGRGASTPYYTSDNSLHRRPAYKKENGSVPYTSSLSSVPGASGNNRSRGLSCFSDDASAESKGSWLETADSMPSVAQTASGYKPAWVGIAGQVFLHCVKMDLLGWRLERNHPWGRLL